MDFYQTNQQTEGEIMNDDEFLQCFRNIFCQKYIYKYLSYKLNI